MERHKLDLKEWPLGPGPSDYIFIEYPKEVNGVIVQNKEEEDALIASLLPKEEKK